MPTAAGQHWILSDGRSAFDLRGGITNGARKREGRPTRWSPRVASLLLNLIGHDLSTKQAAAAAVGIGYQTLMDWQRQRPEWTAAVRKTRRETQGRRKAEAMAIRAAGRVLRRRSAFPRPKPTKQMKLVCWQLTHHIDPFSAIYEEHERQACSRFNLAWGKWEEAKRRFPCLLDQVYDRRKRRPTSSFTVAFGWAGRRR
jgi:hypothetical protein